VEKTIIVQEPNKTIRFKLNKEMEDRKELTNWPRRKAKQDHTTLSQKAKELIKAEWRAEKLATKRERKKQYHGVPLMAVDSGATSTCVREVDAKHTEVLEEDSMKRFLNANGTISKATKKTRLKNGMRYPANDGDVVPDLATQSLLSTSKCADGNYATVFTPEEVQTFDLEAAPFKVEGQIVMRGWRCPQTKLWRVPLHQDWTNVNTETALMSQEVTDIIMSKRWRVRTA